MLAMQIKRKGAQVKKQPQLQVQEMQTLMLMPYANNAKIHTREQLEQIEASIKEFGFNDPVAVWENEQGELEIIEGHGRVLAAQNLGLDTLPIIRLDHLSDEQRRAYTHIHNQLTMNTGFDFEKLEQDLDALDFDFSEFGFDLDLGDKDNEDGVFEKYTEGKGGQLAEKFLVNPFSILDAKSGVWIERKHWWQEHINDKGERGKAALFSENLSSFGPQNSVLDPVLAEIICNWFTPHSASNVFDCFAGDTAFGFVSSYLGHNFTGVELRAEQCEDNIKRCNAYGLKPTYICDDGRNVAKHLEPLSQDLLFSCPPYFDLEVYSDNPNDASNQGDFDSFYAILDEAFKNAISCLNNNRFAVIVCTDVRQKNGFYYDFVERVRKTFEENGMGLYNHLILATSLGSAAYRAARSMVTRKLVRVHQNVLVFYKGNPKDIKNEFGEVELPNESENLEL